VSYDDDERVILQFLTLLACPSAHILPLRQTDGGVGGDSSSKQASKNAKLHKNHTTPSTNQWQAKWVVKTKTNNKKKPTK